MTKTRVCRWKDGARTACPILIDNLSSEEVDDIWGEISNINWNHRAEELERSRLLQLSPQQLTKKHTSNVRRALRSNRAG